MILRKKSREYRAFAAFTVYEVLTSDGGPRHVLEIIMMVAVHYITPYHVNIQIKVSYLFIV